MVMMMIVRIIIITVADQENPFERGGGGMFPKATNVP